MKKTKNKYLLIGLVGLIVGGAAVILTQKAGPMLRKNLIKAMKKQRFPQNAL